MAFFLFEFHLRQAQVYNAKNYHQWLFLCNCNVLRSVKIRFPTLRVITSMPRVLSSLFH